MSEDLVRLLRRSPNNQWMLAAADEIERLRAICNEAQDFIDHDKNCNYLMGRMRNCSCGFDKMWSRLEEARRG